MDIDDEALSAARALLELHGGNQYDKTRPTQTILTSNYGKMCPLCTKTFIFSISLKTHMSVTHKKFLCDLCDAVFSRPWQILYKTIIISKMNYELFLSVMAYFWMYIFEYSSYPIKKQY